jgi:hypothetical protein
MERDWKPDEKLACSHRQGVVGHYQSRSVPAGLQVREQRPLDTASGLMVGAAGSSRAVERSRHRIRDFRVNYLQ